MLGFLPFLVQWLAFSHLGSQLSHLRAPDKTYWTLLSDFNNIPENEIEKFLPQVCSLLIDRDPNQDPDVFRYLERLLAEKCAGCLTFGLRAWSLLKAACQGPSEGIFKSVLANGGATQAREERLRHLTDLMEAATMQGSGLPARVEYLRGLYFKDVSFMLDSLARLGVELKSYPASQRNSNLRNALSQLNALMFNRMLSEGQCGLQQLSQHLGSLGSEDVAAFGSALPSSDPRSGPLIQRIAKGCPELADHSVHLPLQHCDEPVQRILRFVEDECEVLPSKDRCPYLLVCEVLERPYLCKSDRLYAQRTALLRDDGRHQQQLLEHSINPVMAATKFPQHAHTPLQVLHKQQQLQQKELLEHVLNDAFSSYQTLESDAHQAEAKTNIEIFARPDQSIPVSSTVHPGTSLTSELPSKPNSWSNLDHDGSRDSLKCRIDQGKIISPFELEESSREVVSDKEQQNSEDRDTKFQTIDISVLNQSSVHTEPIRTNSISSSDNFKSDSGRISSNTNGTIHNSAHSYNFNGQDHTNVGISSDVKDVFAQSLPQSQSDSTGNQNNSPTNTRTSSTPASASSSSRNSSKSGWRKRRFDPLGFQGGWGGRDVEGKLGPPLQVTDETGQLRDLYCATELSPNFYSLQQQDQHYNNYNYPPQYSSEQNQQFQQQNQPQYESPHSPPQIPQSQVGEFNPNLSHPRKLFFQRGKTAEERRELVRATSAFGHLPGWSVRSFIVKSGDDLRKEIIAMQLIEYCQQVFAQESLDILLRPYQIMSAGRDTGLIEFLEGTKSVDRIKKSYRPVDGEEPLLPSLRDYFEFCFGPSYSIVHSQAVNNFVRSLVGYSLVTYVLQVKDRHNANILIANDGSIIHIDFGFLLGESPGFNINFENAPFKLTREYVDVLGGLQSAAFARFEELFIKGFLALQKHVDGLYAIVQAFYGERRKGAADSMRSRILFATSHADVVGLIRDSLDSWRTKQYDWYQQKANNIIM